MDSLTQIVLGAAVGEAVLGKKVGNKAMLWGGIAGTIPDLDVLVRLFTDDIVLINEVHRGFSHSIVFCILMAPILGWIASKIHKKENLDWKPWAKLFFWSLVTHPLLDAHTNWGTQLFWPFEYRLAYNNIFVADPLYTVPFLICVIAAMFYKRNNPKRYKINRAGILISSSYMLLTLAFKGIAYFQFDDSLKKQEIEYLELDTKPSPLNSILWIADVETEDEYLIGFYSLLDKDNNIEFTRFEKNHELLGKWENESIIQSLIKQSRGWYSIQKEDNKIYFNDLRFGQIGIDNADRKVNFSYELIEEDGVVKAHQRRMKIDNPGQLFDDLVERVKGK